MQHNLQQKTKSHILRNTEDAKRKSRHKLMGSIFLLLIALIVLLNVTSKVKQIPVNPKTIEIQNTDKSKSIVKEAASGVAIAKTTASQATASAASSAIARQTITNGPGINSPKPDASTAVATNTNADVSSGNGYKASIVGENQNQPDKISSQTPEAAKTDTKDSNDTQNNITSLNLSPRITTETSHPKLTPEQILNGETAGTATSKYYIQLTASSDKEKLISMKQKLADKGIRTIIQQVKTADDTTIYRLRMGPYNSKEEANNKLSVLNN